MKKSLATICMAVVLALNAMGCATLKSAVDGVADGVCWLDKKIPACQWAGEKDAPKNDAVDPLPGN